MKKLLLLLTLLFISCHTSKKLNKEIVRKYTIDSCITTISDSTQSESDEKSQDVSEVLGETNPVIEFKEKKINHTQVKNVKITKSKPVIDTNLNSNLGKLIYKIPDTMIVYTNYTITIRISRDKKQIDLIKDLGENTVTTTIKTSSVMDVTLMDSSPDSSFVIKRINTETQLIDTDGYTQWIYTVRPIKHGDKKLDIIVSIIRGDNKKQIVYSGTVHIKESLTKEVNTFWGKYWQWLFTTFLIPIFIFFWKKKKKSE